MHKQINQYGRIYVCNDSYFYPILLDLTGGIHICPELPPELPAIEIHAAAKDRFESINS